MPESLFGESYPYAALLLWHKRCDKEGKGREVLMLKSMWTCEIKKTSL